MKSCKNISLHKVLAMGGTIAQYNAANNNK